MSKGLHVRWLILLLFLVSFPIQSFFGCASTPEETGLTEMAEPMPEPSDMPEEGISICEEVSCDNSCGSQSDCDQLGGDKELVCNNQHCCVESELCSIEDFCLNDNDCGEAEFCNKGEGLEEGCCHCVAECLGNEDCSIGQACEFEVGKETGCCLSPAMFSESKLQKLSAVGDECTEATVVEDCEGIGTDCICFEGRCECLNLLPGCGDCFLQAGEECETGANCPECGPENFITAAHCDPGFVCNKDECFCEPIGGEASFCLGTDNDCEEIGSCEVRFGLGPSFCYASGCPDLPTLDNSGVFCGSNTALPGLGESVCEGLEGALTGVLEPLPEINCVNQGGFNCCISSVINYCPPGDNCIAAGGTCEQRFDLGDEFCWTEPNICPAIPNQNAGVYCGDDENICAAIQSLTGNIAQFSCEAGCCVSDIPTEVDCSDQIDNDNDGDTDCDDSDCELDPNCQVGGIEICDDGQDNDGDTLIDCDDPDCDLDPNCEVGGKEICDDGLDNDGDTLVDCKDPDCAKDPNCAAPEEETCDDQVDNDGDTLVDCDDPDCDLDPNCQVGGGGCCGAGTIFCPFPAPSPEPVGWPCVVPCDMVNECDNGNVFIDEDQCSENCPLGQFLCPDDITCSTTCNENPECPPVGPLPPGIDESSQVCGCELDCGDQMDNDNDTLVDCDDPDCCGKLACSPCPI